MKTERKSAHYRRLAKKQVQCLNEALCFVSSSVLADSLCSEIRFFAKRQTVSTNFMTSYRITKYDPSKRNEQGHYLENSEWTSISDIGKSEYNNVTYEEYQEIESAYVNAIKLIMQNNKFEFLIVDSLELNDKKQDFKKYEKTRLRNITVDFDKEVKSLKNGLRLNVSEIDKIIRLILRETVWMLLVNKDFEVRFGYDYYMYVKTGNLKQETIQKIETSKLFVEPEVEQIKYIITNNDGNEI